MYIFLLVLKHSLQCIRLTSFASESFFNKVKDLGLDELSKLNGEYAVAKQHMYSGFLWLFMKAVWTH